MSIVNVSHSGRLRLLASPLEILVHSSLSVLGLAHDCCEVCAAVVVGTLQLSVHNTIYNYMMIFTSIPLGLAVASNTLVGNALGGGDSATARRAAIASFGVELSLAAVYGVGTILARYKAPLVRVVKVLLHCIRVPQTRLAFSDLHVGSQSSERRGHLAALRCAVHGHGWVAVDWTGRRFRIGCGFEEPPLTVSVVVDSGNLAWCWWTVRGRCCVVCGVLRGVFALCVLPGICCPSGPAWHVVWYVDRVRGCWNLVLDGNLAAEVATHCGTCNADGIRVCTNHVQ
jgi:MatE